MVLEKIDYKKVFYYFEEISNIPRGSKNNQAISDYLYAFGKEKGLECYQDEALNVILIKEATPGYENVPAVILQGHMDMVCEKNSDTEHDFMTEGLKLRMDGDYIYAEGTTLGGDDGIALAFGLAMLSDESLIHPRLEMIFTTDEEIGMDGAMALDTGKLNAKYMINVDSEEEGKILVGCAGGMTSTMKLPLVREDAEGVKIKIAVKGLLGGHSGMEITNNRTNSNLLLGRLLFELSSQASFKVTSMNGGLKDNAIPRESFAEILVSQADTDEVLNKINVFYENYKRELAASEPDFELQTEVSGTIVTEKILTDETLEKILTVLLFTPNGIQVMSSDIAGLPESSLNLGIFQMSESEAVFSYSVRSSISTYKVFLGNKLEKFISLLGGTYEVHGEYPAWELKKESELTRICKKVYVEQYKKEPEIEVIHAGLECGILSDKMEGLDIVSIGPDILDIHTPCEKMSISSVIRVYNYVTGVIEEICKMK